MLDNLISELTDNNDIMPKTEYYYYGLLDNEGWGFFEAGDSRITDDFIKITEEYHQELIDGQGGDKEIVAYDGEVFLADVGRYVMDENFVWHKKNDAEFQLYKLKEAKAQKLLELNEGLSDKQNNTESTITLNLPVTLKKDEDTKEVNSFKLLTITSAGTLSTILTGYVVLASSVDIEDLIVTDEGYTIVGLNELVNGTKLINLIFAAYSHSTALITQYYRTTKDLIQNATSLKELEEIEIDFNQF